MPDRRTEILSTALGLVADQGLKGLTHRAVDAAAELPLGTTSNYFRSRAALVEAVLGRLEDLDLELTQSARPDAAPATVDDIVAGLTAALLALAGEHAALSRARLSFSLDRPDAVSAGHRRLTLGLEQGLQALGVPDAARRARAVADYGDGLLLHALTVRRDEPLDPDATATAIRALLLG
ncbi:TetR/AcrR family transcriptional regulator [Planctomonas deserti]|uniref:TetR/AcrR family transcriptional regulator n=1 Tax=Planctomonas deserti TaxID=2144185 RepID=UPI000D35C2F5|nr:TetR family transcriptional regulator [Planctomonas deserti]